MTYLWTFLYASRSVTGADNGAVVSLVSSSHTFNYFRLVLMLSSQTFLAT